jgi:hypothetical protein
MGADQQCAVQAECLAGSTSRAQAEQHLSVYNPLCCAGPSPRAADTQTRAKPWHQKLVPMDTAAARWKGDLNGKDARAPHLTKAQALVGRMKGLCMFCYRQGGEGCFTVKGACTSPTRFLLTRWWAT